LTVNTEATQAILAAIERVREDLHEVKGDMKEVKVEVRATNGRVTKLEMWRHGLDAIKESRTGRGVVLIGVVTGTTVAVFAAIVGVVVKLLGG